MTSADFQRYVMHDRSEFLDRFLAVLRAQDVQFCIIGGQAVNAYAMPLVSLDLDVIVVASKLPELERVLSGQFAVERCEHSLNVSDPDSELRVQIQLDERYQGFLQDRSDYEVLGRRIPVASIENVMRGKLWAFADPTRRASKRQKDLADIARLLEAQPRLTAMVPEEVHRKLV